ncbi:MAG: glycosyltransferase family 39 protein, partial [Parcubacteria group bacterium]|nr:glycosyltransferase family 39 protein [Parcubacteria group bacterium]
FKTFIKEKVEISKFEILIIVIITFITLFNVLFYHEMPRGRDDMGYIAAAAQLVETGSLSFDDPLTHPYHPFRNLGDDTFTSRFLPGYTTYLSIFYILFGSQSIFWANALLIFPSLLIIYFIGKELLNRKAGLISVLLISTFYTSFWFPRRTVSENLLMFLLLFGSWLTVYAFKKKKAGYFFLALPVFSFSILVRGEAIGYLITFLLVLILGMIKFKKEIKNNLQFIIPGSILFLTNLYLFKSYGDLYGTGYINYVIENANNALWFIWGLNYLTLFFILLGVMLLFVIYYLYKNKFFIIKESKVTKFRNIILLLTFLIFVGYEIFALYEFGNNEYIKWNFFDNQYVFFSFIKYYLIIYVGIFLYGVYKKYYSKIVYAIIFILSPAFIFFKSPHIAPDHPWFMRRFYPVIIPLIIILASIVLVKIFKDKKKIYTVILILIIINFSISIPIIAFKENQGIEEQLESLANKFSQTDLVLMEPGWQWQQWGYALHYVYGMNILPNVDELKKNNFPGLLKKYNNIYIISTKRYNIYPGYEDNNLEYLCEWKLKYSYLERDSWLTYYIDHNREELEIRKLKDGLKNIPPQKINKTEETYYIFEVKNKAELNIDELFIYNNESF